MISSFPFLIEFSFCYLALLIEKFIFPSMNYIFTFASPPQKKTTQAWFCGSIFGSLPIDPPTQAPHHTVMAVNQRSKA